MTDLLETLTANCGQTTAGTPLQWGTANGFVYADTPEGITLIVIPSDNAESMIGYARENKGEKGVHAVLSELGKTISQTERVFFSWETLKPKLYGMLRTLDELGEGDESPRNNAIWQHVCGEVCIVLAADMDPQITGITNSVLQRLGLTPEQCWQAARANIRSWFASRRWSIDVNREAGLHEPVIAISDDDLRSSTLIIEPDLLAGIAKKHGISDPAITAPLEGIVIVGSKRDSGYMRSCAKAMIALAIKDNANIELSDDVFLINPDGTLSIEGFLL